MSKKQKIAENLKILEEEFASDSEGQDVGQTIDVNFEGFTAEDDDFHGIKRLLSQTFRGLDVNLTDMSDIIVQQNYVGSVIKQVIDDVEEAMEVDNDALEGEPDEESDYVFGVNTVVNINNTKKKSTCLDKLRTELITKCTNSSASDEIKNKIREALSQTKENVGLLISERLVNLPSDIAVPAYSSLLDEMQEAVKIGLPFDFKYLLVICKLYKLKTLKAKKKEKKLKNQGDEQGESSSEAGRKFKEIYTNEEEELFESCCDDSFDYQVQDINTFDAESWNNKELPQNDAIELRRVFFLPFEKFPDIVNTFSIMQSEEAEEE